MTSLVEVRLGTWTSVVLMEVSTTTFTSPIQVSPTAELIVTAILEEVSLDVQSLTGQRTMVVASKHQLGMMTRLVVTMVVMAEMAAFLVELFSVQHSIPQMVQTLTSTSVATKRVATARQVRCNPRVPSFIRRSGWGGFQEIVVAMATLTSLSMV
jgi:hypothetical protein